MKLYYKLDYIIYAYSSYFNHKLKGGNYENRLSKNLSITSIKEKIESNKQKRIAFFVAYHKKDEIPVSNKEYIKFLSNCSFFIVYIHNGKLNNEVISQLEYMGCYVICRKNIGQDFGAWKDITLTLHKYKVTDNVEWTLLCNDSNFYLGGYNGKDFERRFLDELTKNDQKDFISLNCNYESKMHYQSYFLCFSKRITRNKKYIKFWKNYLPLNHRYHAIERGEKKLSKKILNYFNPCVMFTSFDIYTNITSNIEENSKENIVEVLPKNCFHFISCFNQNKLDNLSVQKLMHVLEVYNPSHTLALLFIVYCQSPFLKKDIIRHGHFSSQQIQKFICSNEIIQNDSLRDEIIQHFLKSGLPNSYFEEKKEAYRKGINIFGQKYDAYSDAKIYLAKYLESSEI